MYLQYEAFVARYVLWGRMILANISVSKGDLSIFDGLTNLYMRIYQQRSVSWKFDVMNFIVNLSPHKISGVLLHFVETKFSLTHFSCSKVTSLSIAIQICTFEQHNYYNFYQNKKIM